MIRGQLGLPSFCFAWPTESVQNSVFFALNLLKDEKFMITVAAILELIGSSANNYEANTVKAMRLKNGKQVLAIETRLGAAGKRKGRSCTDHLQPILWKWRRQRGLCCTSLQQRTSQHDQRADAGWKFPE